MTQDFAKDPGIAFIEDMRQDLAKDLDIPVTLGEFVRRQAAKHRDACLGCWFESDTRLTYAAFDRQADCLASSLLRQGVRKGVHVAVMLPNCPAFPITWLALARLGAVMVPVNISYKPDELHFVLTDADVQYLVIDEACLLTFHGMEDRPPLITDARIVVHGASTPAGMQHWQTLQDTGKAPFEPPYVVSPHDLVNIQYTSGTTGFPKGCMLAQDYWVVLGRSAAYRSAEMQAKNALIWAPFFYMDPQWQFLAVMWSGGTAYVARTMHLTRLHDWLAEYPIHTCIYPEPALKYPLDKAQAQRIQLRSLAIFGWSIEGRSQVEQRFPGAVAREAYGMTEIGSGTLVPPPAVDVARTRCVGQPAPFRELRIVDPENIAGGEVPIGQEGELWVRGRSILLGYYKRPDANREQFVGGWFRTGDVFRRDERGYHFIVGRMKDMVRRAGENISAIEVETVLRAMPGIEDAAVVPVPDALRREEVKAYVKLREAAASVEQSLCDRIFTHCRKRLANFKVPRYLAFIEGDFPRTASGKILKRDLIKDIPDLRIGAFDRVDGIWR